MNYDVVYYWVGGTDRGQWHTAFANCGSLTATLDEVNRQGYYAVKGQLSIGAPEGAPADLTEWFDRTHRIGYQA